MLAEDGTLFVADSVNNRIRRISPEGVISTVAGTGTQGFAGDGAAALDAMLDGPVDVALGPDGSLYVSDAGNRRIRKVGPGGIIDTIAGDGTRLRGVSLPACAPPLGTPASLAVASDGAIYVAVEEGHRIRAITPDGCIRNLPPPSFPGAGSAPALTFLDESNLLAALGSNLYQYLLSPSATASPAEAGVSRVELPSQPGRTLGTLTTTTSGIYACDTRQRELLHLEF